MATKHSEQGWQVGKTLSQCNSYMFDNQVACDIKFSIQSPDGSTVTVPAHKYMLVSRSPVFEAMLCGPGDYSEAKGNVVIIDIEPDIFKSLLRFIYTAETPISADNVLHIMAAAKKYIVDALVEKCAEFLETNIDIENACTILNHAVLLNEEKIIGKCLQIIAPQTEQTLNSESFLELSRPALNKLLECDDLEVDSELFVLEACKSWARHNSEQTGELTDKEIRETLGDSFCRLRLTSLTPKEILKIGPSQILTDDEFRSLSLYCSRKKECEDHRKHAKEQLANKGYKVIPRKVRKAACTVSRLKDDTNSVWPLSGEPDMIGFSVSRVIKVIGISVYSSSKAGDVHDCNLEIYDGTKREWIGKTSTTLTSNGTDQKQTMMLQNPVTLQPDTGHAIKITQVGPSCYYGLNGIDQVTFGKVTFTFNNDHDNSRTSVTCGQIPDIIFHIVQ